MEMVIFDWDGMHAVRRGSGDRPPGGGGGRVPLRLGGGVLHRSV